MCFILKHGNGNSVHQQPIQLASYHGLDTLLQRLLQRFMFLVDVHNPWDKKMAARELRNAKNSMTFTPFVCMFQVTICVFRLSRLNPVLISIFAEDNISYEWKRLSPPGLAPSPRHRHQAVIIGKKMFVFGGLGDRSEGAPEVYCFEVKFFFFFFFFFFFLLLLLKAKAISRL